MLTRLKRNKILCLIAGCAILLCVILLCVFPRSKNVEKKEHILIVETPPKLSILDTDPFLIDVEVSSFGDAIYPAASMSLSFDSSRLEFLGIEEGNVFIKSENSSGQALPEWNYNIDVCNETGKINVMYLDVTGGKNAFSNDLLAEDDNVVLRLKFRLRGSTRTGDVCDIIVEDAVFAASDETESLAMARGTLVVKNGKLVIGE